MEKADTSNAWCGNMISLSNALWPSSRPLLLQAARNTLPRARQPTYTHTALRTHAQVNRVSRRVQTAEPTSVVAVTTTIAGQRAATSQARTAISRARRTRGGSEEVKCLKSTAVPSSTAKHTAPAFRQIPIRRPDWVRRASGGCRAATATTRAC